MDHAKAGVFQEPNQIGLCSFLQGQNGMHLEVHVKSSHFKGYLANYMQKREFAYKKVCTFLKVMDSHRATVPSWYLWDFFTLPAFSNSFLGALLPMIGQSFLLAGFSLPDVDGPASAAIWTHCQVGNNPSNLSQLLSLLYPPLQLTLSRGFLLYWQWGFLSLHMDLGLCPHLPAPLVFPLSRCYFHSKHAGILKETVSQSEAKSVS